MSSSVVSLRRVEAQRDEPHPRRFRFGKQSLCRATAAYADVTGVTLRDTDLKGFVCRKQKAAWVLGIERRVKGTLYRVPISEFTPATNPGSIGDARTKAQRIMSELADGTYKSDAEKDVQDVQERRLAELTIHAAPKFHAKENPHVRESTIESYTYAVRRMFLKDVKMSDITADMVRDEYQRMLGQISAATAANSLRSVRALWQSWADAHPDGQEPVGNPVRKLTVKRKAVKATPPREGALTPVQRPLWWAEVQRQSEMAGPTGGMLRALQLLFLTGCRRDEVLHLRWDEVGDDIITISADRMKAGTALTRPITPEMRRILDAQRGMSEEWVFPARRGDGAAQDPRKAMAAVNAAVGTNVSAHDLRRTFISTAETAGVPTVATKMLVGHSTGDITEAYAKALRPQLLDFAKRIEKELLS